MNFKLLRSIFKNFPMRCDWSRKGYKPAFNHSNNLTNTLSRYFKFSFKPFALCVVGGEHIPGTRSSVKNSSHHRIFLWTWNHQITSAHLTLNLGEQFPLNSKRTETFSQGLMDPESLDHHWPPFCCWQEDLRIGSVFSVTPAAETQTLPVVNPSSLHMFCSHCKKSLMKGQTAFQRKGSAALFCSTACLTSSLPAVKGVTKICHNCQKWVQQGTLPSFHPLHCSDSYGRISCVRNGRVTACI